jgi:cytoskeleton protein RodZ
MSEAAGTMLATDPGMPEVSPGRQLAAARQAQGLAPADVARELKLSVWQVEALEAGRYQQLPGPLFVRGFIRNYARLLKLEPQALVQAAAAVMPQAAQSYEAPRSKDIPFPGRAPNRWPVYAAAALAVAGALAAYEFYNEPQSPGQDSAVAPAPAVAPPRSNSVVVTLPAAVPVVTDEPVARAPSDAGVIAPSAPATALASEPERPLARPGERQVTLEFADDSWVEIRDGRERILFSQLNRPGTQQQVTGVPPFSIVVGNARGVRMTYDAQPVDLEPHIRADVARLILQ